MWIRKTNQYHNQIKAVFKEGRIITEIENPSVSLIPKEFIIEQNYPNTFNPVTTIKYNLKESVDHNLKVKFIVYDIPGKEVRL